MRVRESLVVLTQDASLANAIRTVSAPEHELFVVQAEADVATHLMANAAGVVVLDTAAVVSAIAQLTHSLKKQFPDVVLIVAGAASEQSTLTPEVTSGAVYRFLHKPASEQRIKLFIEAAWRRRSAGNTGAFTTSTHVRLDAPAPPRSLAPAIGLGALVLAVVTGVGGWFMGQSGRATHSIPQAQHVTRPAATAAAPADAALKQLLARAAEALARGDLILPVGNSAADLYRQALELHYGDPQAQAGLDKVVDQILSAAEQDLLAQHLDEAEHMIQAARALAPASTRVSFLTTQLARERERAARTQARLQQQQADERERQRQLVSVARAALTAGNLDEAARLITAAADGGVEHDAVNTLARDLQGARLVAKMNEALVKPAAVAPIEIAPAAPTPSTPVQSTSVQPAPTAPEAASQPSAVVSASTLQRVKYVTPEYPLAARAQGTSGWVDLAFDVELDGSVGDVAVLAAEPKNSFERAAVAAVRQWRYQPVLRDGHPIVRRAQLRIRFAVQ